VLFFPVFTLFFFASFSRNCNPKWLVEFSTCLLLEGLLRAFFAGDLPPVFFCVSAVRAVGDQPFSLPARQPTKPSEPLSVSRVLFSRTDLTRFYAYRCGYILWVTGTTSSDPLDPPFRDARFRFLSTKLSFFEPVRWYDFLPVGNLKSAAISPFSQVNTPLPRPQIPPQWPLLVSRPSPPPPSFPS